MSAPLVLLAGNPNSGKTTLFNRLTGSRAKVANYPGVTVSPFAGTLRLEAVGEVDVLDLPGTYSLSARSPDEQIAVDALLGQGRRADAVVVVSDASALARNLYLALQVLETGVPTIIAMTMMDEARATGLALDTVRLAERLGVGIVEIVASTGEGHERLVQALTAALKPGAAHKPRVQTPLAHEVEEDLAPIAAAVTSTLAPRSDAEARALVLWAALSVGDDELARVPPAVREAVAAARSRAERRGADLDLAIVESRYRLIDRVLEGVCGPVPVNARTERIDAVLTHPIAGLIVFVIVMLSVFQVLFSGAEPAVALIESAVGAVQAWIAATLPAGPLASLLSQGIVAGVGNVVVFVPQIALLFLFIGFLEDSGYLARVAFVIDRVMGGVGLHGKAFVPMLSGFACAIPAVMATRTIESRKDRLITMLALPFTSCSARLPIYLLVVATVFNGEAPVLGVLSVGALVLLSMYSLSVIAALSAAAVLRRTVLKAPRPTLILELPPYRRPQFRNLAVNVGQQVRSFLVEAGTVILSLTIILWVLLSYPRLAETTEVFATRQAEATASLSGGALEARRAELASAEAGQRLRESVAGRLGHVLEPALEPLGFDWRIGIGILGAFAAREVFVSTLGIVFDIADADESNESLRQALKHATWPDGRRLLTPLSGVCLMVFFVLACQCMSTLGVVARESRSWKWPLFLFSYMTVLAYVVTLILYQTGQALGIGV
ncbi:MAG: ferrous iron transport protein B [Vicinamibacteria bacterium]|nr:ferrous iron transport protein B [Vicinamibacteria bacterium]MBP9946319.1 ferrous iron transport protein B [Vicinamibacteria bacterium]